jgi:hypothetical protein
MAKTESALEGEIVVPADQVADLVRKATQLPPTYFVSVGKAKIQADGSLRCKYSASTAGAPPDPIDPES